MKKTIIQALIGVIIVGLGVYTTYTYVGTINTGGNLILLLLSLLLISLGVYFLIRSGKSDNTVINKGLGVKTNLGNTGLASVLEKNNSLSSRWSKTIEKRDRLKMLEISTAAQTDTKD